MNRIIRTRIGAILYVLSSPVLALLLMQIPLAEPGNPFVYVNPFMESEVHRGVFLALAAWEGFALCTFVPFAHWAIVTWREKQPVTQISNRGGVVRALLMWFPAALAAPVFYVLNIVWLLRGRYPNQPWPRMKLSSFVPVILLIAVFMIASAVNNARLYGPAETPEKALMPQAKNPQVLAKLPQADGSLLMISFGECGIVEETPEGWVLREAYKSTLQQLTDGEKTVHAYFCRSQTAETDVVIVWKVAFAGDETGRAARPPRDSEASAFTAVISENPVCTEYFYYALADVDAPGYQIWLE